VEAPRFAVAWLFAAGLVLAAAGAGGIVAGTFFSAWLYGLLPPVIIDAAAVGGAATATGAALAGLGVLHLFGAALLWRGIGEVVTAAAVLAATMVLLCIGWGVAAIVSAGSGAGPAIGLVPAGIGLGLVAVGYGWTARGLISLRERPGART
jgi:hypothetical protein